jgi:phosphate transport system substrate-binding protein
MALHKLENLAQTSDMKGCSIAIASLVVGAALSSASADTFIVQGSTTFNQRLMGPYQAAVEASSGHKLIVVPNKSTTGMLALFEQRADFAMISTPLEGEIAQAKAINPDLPADRLRVFEVSRTRMAFAINPANPVRSISRANLRGILQGKITNWRAVGGPDLPIRVVMVREGGGVQLSIESQLLDGAKITPADLINVQISSQVTKIVQQEPSALGLAQLGMLIRADLPELTTDSAIEQPLSLITLGEPTPAMHDVINVMRQIVSTARQ